MARGRVAAVQGQQLPTCSWGDDLEHPDTRQNHESLGYRSLQGGLDPSCSRSRPYG